MSNQLSNPFTVSIAAPAPTVTVLKTPGDTFTDSSGAKWIVVASAKPDIPGQVGFTRNGVQVAFSVNFGQPDATGKMFIQDQDPGGAPYWLVWSASGLVRGPAPA